MRNKAINNCSGSLKRARERGSVGLVAMIFLGLAALTIMTLMASGSFRDLRSLENSYTKLNEKWRARSEVNILAAVVLKDAPAQLDADVKFGRDNCNVDMVLPIFDPEGLPAGTSDPAITFNGTTPNCANPPAATSIFGTFEAWRDARIAVFKTTAVNTFNLDADKINIVEIKEIYRRTVGSGGLASDTAYAVRFVVEAKFGNYRTRTNGEIILGSNTPGCGTSVVVEVTPSIVSPGNPVDMSIRYTFAGRLQIYNSANVLIQDQIVGEQPSAQTYVYTFTPAVTDTYRVVATGSGGCSAQSSAITVTVANPPPVCPTINNFSASSNSVLAGEEVTVSWDVSDAVAVTVNGVAVAAVGSLTQKVFVPTTFTLVAQDAANSCPVTQQVTVNITPPPPGCTFSTPTITSFDANPTSLALGGNSTLSWNVSGVDVSGTTVISGPNSFNQSVGTSGSLAVTPPNVAGNYSYTLKAENICPDGTRLTAQQVVIISVQACPPPVIDSFVANPSTVAQNGNQTVTLSWNISGTADAVSIDNGVGGGLPAAGTVAIPQPNTTTTYTITVVGCGQTRQTQVTVTVTSCPVPVINNFTANPLVVVQGGNQTVVLNWSVSGTVDSQSIDQGIGAVSGNSISIPQPQTTTTYTYSVVGCGQTRTAQVTVTVSVVPLSGCLLPELDLLFNNTYTGVFGSYTTRGYITSNRIGNVLSFVIDVESREPGLGSFDPRPLDTFTITDSTTGQVYFNRGGIAIVVPGIGIIYPPQIGTGSLTNTGNVVRNGRTLTRTEIFADIPSTSINYFAGYNVFFNNGFGGTTTALRTVRNCP